MEQKTNHDLWLAATAALLILMPNMAHAACSTPTANEGGIIYNSTYHVLQFCNGSDWINAGGGAGAETDPQVNTLTNTKWCTSDGTVINCASDLPAAGAETDPQVGTLTNTKWCTTNGTLIDCTSDAPGGGTMTCPTGFTLVTAQSRILGCIQNNEQGSALWFSANNTCFTTYGGRLPSISELAISFSNYALTAEADDNELTDNIRWDWDLPETIVTTYAGGSGDASWQYSSSSSPYRCFIPAK